MIAWFRVVAVGWWEVAQSEYTLKVQPTKFANGLDVGCIREDSGMSSRFLV